MSWLFSTNVPEFQPDYTGEGPALGRSWDLWIETFELALEVNHVTDSGTKMAALFYLGGPLLRQHFKNGKTTNTPATYDGVKECLTAYYAASRNKFREELSFRQLRRNPGEPWVAFSSRVFSHALELNLSGLADKLHEHYAIMQCIAGAGSEKIRQVILRDKDLTIARMNAAVSEYELTTLQLTEAAAQPASSESLANAVSHQNSSKKRFKKKSSAATASSSGKRSCYRCGADLHADRSTCPALNSKCNSCSKMGHYAKVCRSNPQQQGNQQHKKKSAHNVDSVFPNDEDDAYDFVLAVSSPTNPSKRQRKVLLTINDVEVPFLIDTGSSYTIISSEVFDTISNLQLRPTSTCLYGFCGARPLPMKGETTANLRYKETITQNTRIFIVNGKQRNLLSGIDAEQLGLITFHVNQVTASKMAKEGSEKLHESLREKFPKVFTGLGKLKNTKLKLKIDASVPPSAIINRRIPFHWRPAVEREVERLVKLDIVEPVTHPTEWISPIVIVPKPNGTIRLCVDSRCANSAILRKKVMMPTLDDLTNAFNGCKHFSKLDLNEGYHQVSLHESSRDITTFATHHGLWRYKRLSFGINAASELFQETIASILPKEEGVRNILDDVLIGGKDKKEHDEKLIKVLKILQNNQLTLNDKKCQFDVSSLKFFGHIFSSNGIHVDPKKIADIAVLPVPEDASALRSALGMINYCLKFVPHLATIIEPLREALRAPNFIWTKQMEDAWKEVVKRLRTAPSLSYFSPSRRSQLVVDAGPKAVAAIFQQVDRQGKRSIISFYSHTLNSTEQNYSQLEREMLAIVYAALHFQVFLLGKQFDIYTDHLPLVSLLGKPAANLPARIQRLQLKIQAFSFSIHHISGASNPADYVSRHPLPAESHNGFPEVDEYVNAISTADVPRAMTRDDFIHAARDDSEYVQLWTTLREESIGKISKSDELLRKYISIFDELTALPDGLILRGTRLMVPSSLELQIILLAHEGHQGVSKTKEVIRAKLWFPSLDQKVESFIKQCKMCQLVTKEKNNIPSTATPRPPHPWAWIAIDFAELGHQEYLLVGMDLLSKFPIVERVSATSFQQVKRALDRNFAVWGLPVTLFTDNGPPFQSSQFDDYLRLHGISHRKGIPYWPQSNGQVERFIGSLKKSIKIALASKHNVDDAIQTYLLQFRNTPHRSTGSQPSSSSPSSSQPRSSAPAPSGLSKLAKKGGGCDNGIRWLKVNASIM